ncbi:hypothetical protein BKA70DRAFT_1398615 [Coprinopsis sp. MPI-PUGE-AT-0042]|nr:hypothetical protein BKA70DRAFT_1398615 [Coprinopsis sp. MPI-PUGE-AT-0042]
MPQLRSPATTVLLQELSQDSARSYLKAVISTAQTSLASTIEPARNAHARLADIQARVKQLVGGRTIARKDCEKSSPLDHINAVLTLTLHFINLLSLYLGVKLLFEVPWSRGKVGLCQPWIGAIKGVPTSNGGGAGGGNGEGGGVSKYQESRERLIHPNLHDKALENKNNCWVQLVMQIAAGSRTQASDLTSS